MQRIKIEKMVLNTKVYPDFQNEIRKENGFTLIEFLVVTAQNVRRRGRDGAVIANLSSRNYLY
ncbi:hypothetical protein COU96_01940 [Candidatus Shapirobacteria bacterium CG10_big_fil_rev_8_21_14_0_10_38_14]|uniref:Uncharacterized protein n=1 Tax=Candidatus Shapirobacteria bacterium CG10_big_fil_rev_8_21_14_0_10_38_14 TaxID=1974483 RepID=A0A2M8L5B6_9BACT|nr:MAG: hypothetical protein COU96_01940 [Candidatus Shapirobacteria bacterium CG10_big_fil_rev_8_21_14_0_10_38_14]